MNYTNLNLPEATVKLLAEKGGIKALADGDIAVENDNLEALLLALKSAGAGKPIGYCKYYTVDKGNYSGSNRTHLPSIPASILVKELEEKPFEEELRQLINRYSRENRSNTPDFILADFLLQSLVAYENTLVLREQWYGRNRNEKEVVLKPSPLRITREMIKEKFNCQEFEIVNEKG